MASSSHSRFKKRKARRQQQPASRKSKDEIVPRYPPPGAEALAHTIDQFIARANISRPTAYRLMANGGLKFTYIRSHRMIPVTEYSRLGLVVEG
jgi:hypothetical protein